MGCCEAKPNIEGTGNEIENSIRSVIMNLEINNISISEFEQKFKSIMNCSIHDINDSKPYTQEAFQEIKDKILISNNVDNNGIKQQYNFILKPEYDPKKFPFYFFLQIASLLRGTLEEKVKFLEKGCKIHLNPMTIKNMKILIYQYLDVNLLKATSNYIESQRLGGTPDSQSIQFRVYNENNLKNFSFGFLKAVNKIAIKNNQFLAEKDSKEVENEVFKSTDFYEYFNENRILLDGLELRKTFYNKNINPNQVSDSTNNESTIGI